jgi:5-methylcytosine-specific restriction endonuclease McrA
MPDSTLLCVVPRCGRNKHRSKLYCGSHGNRLRQYGDPLAGPPIRAIAAMTSREGTCSVGACDRPIFASGMCAAHSVRARTGIPLDAKPIRKRRRNDEPAAVCSVDACGKPARGGDGFCKSHWATMTGKGAEYSALRRSRKFDGPHERITAADLRGLRAETADCYLCEKPLADPVEFDHVIPLSRGGRHVLANLRPVHKRCYRVKAAHMPPELLPPQVGQLGLWEEVR